MKLPLTRRQQDIYDCLKDREDRGCQAPTFQELCKDLGLRSRGSLHKQVQALVEAGLVEPMHRKQRGIRLVRPESREQGLPMLGFVAAGQPIEALENPQLMEVPEALRGTGDCYVLQVRGDSMIDEGILDGDWVVIEQRSHARNGEIVVALVDGQEATLKRIQQRPGQVILHPANSQMEPLVYPPQRVEIRGVLVGQMRSYR
jgi:repressor LexA